MRTTKKEPERFKVGDWVSFRYGTRKVIAQVIEARGPLGIHRRHLYRIRVARELAEPDSFEMPDDELEAASPLNQRAIIKYLKEGGLVAILRSNLGGSRDQPKGWLTYTPRGDVTHTFIAERGLVGGAAVPSFALYEGRVFTGKEAEVLSFLESFGLSRAESGEIVAAVGTSP
jgi:hypothetical protein